MLKLELVKEGEALRIMALGRGRKNEVFDFISTLETKRRDRVLGRLAHMADHGTYNADLCKHEGEGIFTVRVGEVRLYCFKDRGLLVLTNGALKKTNKANPADLNKARNLRVLWRAQGENDRE